MLSCAYQWRKDAVIKKKKRDKEKIEVIKRYYNVYIYKDMLGDWIVTIARGGLDNALGDVEHIMMKDHQSALALIDEIKMRREKHGYQMVI
jgi:uncharacterized protein YfaA (DUF2138 family)